MKEGVVLLLALVFFATTGFSRDEYIITRVAPTMLPAPNPGGDRRRSGDDQWMAIEVDFKSNAELAEELTFNYYVSIGGKLYTGETNYVNVEKSRELHSVMYISPRALKRAALGKRFSQNLVDNITVRIVNKGVPVAERSMRELRGEWWKAMEPVKGVVLRKSETPFTWVDYDYYEELKPEAH